MGRLSDSDFPHELSRDRCFTVYYGDQFNLNQIILYVPEDNSAPDKGLGVAKQWVHGLRLTVDIINSENYLQRYKKILSREYRLARSGGRSYAITDSPPNSNHYLNYFKARGAPK